VRKLFGVLCLLILILSLSSSYTYAVNFVENGKISLAVKNRQLTLKAENVSFKKVLQEIAAKTGIQMQIFDGVKDRNVSVDVVNLPYYSISTLLDRMGIQNYGVAYEKDTGREYVYVVTPGTDLGEVTRGKTVIKKANFADGKDALKVKGKDIVRVKDEKKGYSIGYVKDEVLLKFHLGVDRNEIDEILKKHNLVAAKDGGLDSIGYIKATISDGRDVKQVIKEIGKEFKLKIPEPNYVQSVMAVTDPLYDDQWYIPEAGFDKAWEKLKSKTQVKVAVIDTGVDAGHPDLKDRVLKWYDFINNKADTSDDNGHGTFVSGIIAANANDIGIKGLYDLAKILPVKVMDANGVGTYEDAAKGIIFSADNGARVINLSIGGYGYSAMLRDAVDYALGKGCILVAAGGNDAIEQEIYPAAYPDVIGVSALDRNGAIWAGSNKGKHIDVAAPGAGILSVGLGKAYTYGSGTSAATPMVSALAAMLAVEKPDYAGSVVARLIQQTAKDLGEKGRDNIFGSGKMDASVALEKQVRPFHDVAVRNVTVEPKIIETGKPFHIIAAIQNTGTFSSERADISIYQIVNDKQELIAKRHNVLIVKNLNIYYDITKYVSKKQFSFKITIDSINDNNISNNSFATSAFTVTEKGNLTTLYANSPPVHGWIALQAFKLLESKYPDSSFVNELSTYLPVNQDAFWSNEIGYHISYYGSDFRPPLQWMDLSEDEPFTKNTALIEGAWEEDGNVVYEERTKNHFWDPDGGYNKGLIDFVDSALTKANTDRFAKAIANYKNNPINAYYWLGRTAHLLMDMSVPSHTLIDAHVVNKDEYEIYTATNYRNILSTSNNTDIPINYLSYPYAKPDGFDDKLTNMFYSLAYTANKYDSDDQDGKSYEYGKGVFRFGRNTISKDKSVVKVECWDSVLGFNTPWEKNSTCPRIFITRL